MNRAIFFLGEGRAEIRETPMPAPSPGEVLVRALISAPSAGTELLFYRGDARSDIPVDSMIQGLTSTVSYPMKYGYAVVGEVLAGNGEEHEPRRVFAFRPHEAFFTSTDDDLYVIPDDVAMEDAAFMANAETAINLVMDGMPAVGEKIVVIGQGVVGLLLTAALSRYPLAALVTIDRFALRRKMSLHAGAGRTFDPDEGATAVRAALDDKTYQGADLVYEVSGNPAALDLALDIVGFNGRVVVGSWYGTKRGRVDLGGRFHRDRITVLSSQVSTIAPQWSGRWTKNRRMQQAIELLRYITPSAFVTHRFPVEQANEAYRMIDHCQDQTVQVVFTYE